MNKHKISYTVLLLFFVLLAAYFFTEKMNSNQMKKIEIGSQVPNFSLFNQEGKLFVLDSLLGKKNLVIYFYPKDDTPGCTKEACYFQDKFEVFKQANAEVIGISGQSIESHKAFARKYKLTFTLLSDPANKVRNLFGVPSNFLGLIPGRVSYVVDKSGKIIYTFNSQIQATKHVDEALRILEGLK